MKIQNPTAYIGIIAILVALFFVTNVDQLISKPLDLPTIETEVLNQTIGTVKLKVPAVDNEGNGVVTHLSVEARSGNGKILIDVNNLLFWIDTQYSIITAQRVAQNITKMDLSDVDLIYAIETEAQVIEGPSAGAALTIATIAALENKTLKDDVMITGTISPDGTIGSVGSIVEKGKVAKDVGAKIFLVPYGQGTGKQYKPVQRCEKVGQINWCEITYEAEKINITKDTDIEIVEVRTVEEAFKYFIP